MYLDPFTLLAANILIVPLVSVIFYVVWLGSRGSVALLWMAAAYFTTAMGLVSRITLPVEFGIVMSNGLIGAGAVCVWMACRQLRHRPLFPALLLVPLLIWVLLSRLPGFLDQVNLRVITANLIMAPVLALAARELLLLDHETRVINRCIAGVLGVHSLIYVSWAAYNAFAPRHLGTDFLSIPGIVVIHGTTLIFSFLLAVGMMVLIRERDALNDRRKASMDALTGLGNRRSLDECLDQAVAMSRRGGDSLALIMIDADYFKSYNDLYGHLRGDDCLRSIAQALQSSLVRAGEKVFRYGGEEFIVLLPKLSQGEAINVGERLRLAVRALQLTHPGQKSGLVTISLGVAVMTPHQPFATSYALIGAADEALYRAKQLGRDRVEVATMPLATPGTSEASHSANTASAAE